MEDKNKMRPPTDKIIPEDRKTGAPEYSDEQYQTWLEEMRPFLRQGCSLYYAMDKTGLESFKNAIYRKFNLKDWFWEKVTKLQATISELNNSVIFKVVERVNDRLVESKNVAIDPQEAKIIALVAEKHRTSQPFWVNKVETAESKEEDFGRVVETPTIEYLVPQEDATEPQNTDQAGDQVGADATTTPSVAETNGSGN